MIPATPGSVTPDPERVDELSRRSSIHDHSGEQSSGSLNESDLEPEDLIPKYVSAKERLYRGQPELFDPRTGAFKATQRQIRLENHGLESSRLLNSVRRCLEKIEADALFDQHEAAGRWRARLQEVAQEVSLSRANEKAATGRHKPESHIQRVKGPVEEMVSNEGKNEIESDGDDGLLGQIFASGDDETVLRTNDEAGSNINSTVRIRDFGEWLGISPRRVLDDACKARLVPSP